MPGILGIISEHSETDLFSRMFKSLNHYDYYTDSFELNGIHLGRIHLKYVNLQEQPVFSKDRRFALIMTGEIFSYKNVETAEINSDSEFVLNILINEGFSALPFLNGHFNVALFDFLEKKLILISDRYGTRPLYYALNNNRFIFAPEVKAILNDNINKEIDYSAISDLLHFTHVFGHHTVFKNINQLPEASYLTFHNGQIEIQKYWDWPFYPEAYSSEKISKISREKYIDELDHLIELSMKRVMTKNKEDLLFSLSGGLDSRYVVAYADKFGIQNINAFTFGPPHCDDQRFSRIVAQKLNLIHHAYEVNPSKIWEHSKLFAHYSDYLGIINGSVQGFPALLDNYHKKTVTISSQMADAVFGGNLWRKKIKYLMSIDSFNTEGKDILINIFNLVNEDLLKTLFSENFYSKIKNAYKEVPQQYIDKYKHPLFTYINLLMNEHGRRGTLSGNLMNNLFLETRMPSYDYELLDFAYKLPLSLRFNQNAYRRVFSREFPELAKIRRERYNLRIDSPDFLYEMRVLENKVVKTINRTPFKFLLKINPDWVRPTYINHNKWLQNELNNDLKNLFTAPITQSRGIFNMEGVEKLINNKNELSDNSKILWQLVNLEYFFRDFVD